MLAEYLSNLDQKQIGRIYALEGLDGAGKTSIGKQLAKETNSSYLYCTDNSKLKRFRNFFDDKSTPVRFMYYCGLSLETRAQAKELSKNGDVFIDRYLPATIAYHKALGLSDHWTNLIPNSFLDEISAVIYIGVDEEERIRRLGERGSNKSDFKSIELAHRIEEEYFKILPERTIIINNNSTISNAVNEIKLRIYG